MKNIFLQTEKKTIFFPTVISLGITGIGWGRTRLWPGVMDEWITGSDRAKRTTLVRQSAGHWCVVSADSDHRFQGCQTRFRTRFLPISHVWSVRTIVYFLLVFVFCVFWCGIVLTVTTGEVVRQRKGFWLVFFCLGFVFIIVILFIACLMNISSPDTVRPKLSNQMLEELTHPTAIDGMLKKR